jgi:predicted permease
MTSHDPDARSEWIFARLLVVLPRDFHARFAHEITQLFSDQLRDARRRRGARGVAAVWLRAVTGLARAAVLEHIAALHYLVRSRNMLDSLRGDLHFTGRMLRKSPLFTIVAVSCIALGSGAVATIFSAMNAMVLRPLPGAEDAKQLFRMERKEPGKNDGISASYPFYEYLRDRTRTLDGVVAWGKASLSLRGTGEPGTAVYGSYVSGNFFNVLGVRPRLGRFFLPEEDRTDMTHPVIVVSEGFWRSRLGADSGAVGRELWVNGHRFTLIGVAPAEFQGLDAPIQSEAYLPVRMRRMLMPNAAPLTSASAIWMRMAGRVKPDISADAARRELSALAGQLASTASEPTWQAKYTDVRLSQLTGLPPDATGPLAGFLGILLAAAALVLLIASVNVGAMLSARAVARRREMAVRAALGAARSRLIRQLLTEILVLFVFGALGGIALAIMATAALERMPVPADIQITLELSPDPRVFGFALGISLLTGVIVGLAPALRAARSDVAARLRDGAAASSARRTFMTNGLVVGQLALSLLLLVGAGLFVRALQRGNQLDPGFKAAGVTTAIMNAESWGYDEAKARVFFRALSDRAAALPGVTAVSYTTILPLALRSSIEDIHVDGSAASGPNGARVHQLQVDAGYFAVLQLPIVAGREIGRQDDERAAKIAVVNETFAKRFWPDGGALGRTVRVGDDRITVVGLARDPKYSSLTEATPPFVYFPLAQQFRSHLSLMIRTSSDPRALAPAVHDLVRSIDPGLPRPTMITLPDAMGLGLLPQRVAALVTGVLGAVGLLLATVGLYGIIAYSVSRRTKEIGIRLALGARSVDVLRMIVREGMRLTAVGMAIGLALAFAVTRVIARFLFGVSPLDAVTFVGMAAVFIAFALLASWLPARRAAAANPMVALRSD